MDFLMTTKVHIILTLDIRRLVSCLHVAYQAGITRNATCHIANEHGVSLQHT